MLPKFAFYLGHLNAYNRDYWKENEKGILFEDGKRYKESQKDKTGIRESLNGENDAMQFSARAVIGRYNTHYMPLGWLLPNDGYGAGYGQTDTLYGNIQNLKHLGEYAREQGVEIGLWTQSDLHPKPDISALLQRDLVKEVRDAGVRVLKTDVAWVGSGYSFGLNGVADAAQFMIYYGTPDQGGASIRNLFDFDENSSCHTKWQEKAVPFEFTMNLKSVNQLEKLQYLPRPDAGNGTLLKGTIYHALQKGQWVKAGDFEWAANGETKEFQFADHPSVGFLKIEVTAAVGDFGSGNALYVFKVPGSESYIPGDINHDDKIDRNDLTSYSNYMGLRRGDADFEGYISKGDLNTNGLIDAYDVSVVVTQLEEGVPSTEDVKPMAGNVKPSTLKTGYSAGETAEITVTGDNLHEVNALSFALPYDAQDFEFSGVEPLQVKTMENLTNDRLHTNGEKSLYLTFVNIGEQPVLTGSEKLFVIKLTAKRDAQLDLKPIDGLIVDRELNQQKLWQE